MKIKPILKFPFLILKKAAKVALKTTLLIGATGALTLGSHQAYVNNKISKQDYKTIEQMFTDAEVFGTDMKLASYQAFLTKAHRLTHNNGDPIYVYISNDFNSAEQKAINIVLDYVSDIFESINPKYSKFQYVSASEVARKALDGQTSFTFEKTSLGSKNSGGAALRWYNVLNLDYLNGATITINPEYNYLYETDLEHIKNQDTQDKIINLITEDKDENNVRITQYFAVVLEEIMHAYGLGDVYYNNFDHKFYEIGLNNTTNIVHNNTFMNNETSTRKPFLYPEDYKILMAMYFEGNNATPQEYEAAKYLIETYENLFFSSKKENLIKFMQMRNQHKEVNYENISKQELSQGVEIVKNSNSMNYGAIKNGANTFKVLDYKISLKDNLLLVSVFDNKTKEHLETVSTTYKLIDGIVYSDNLHFKKTSVMLGGDSTMYTEGGRISNVAVIKHQGGFEIYDLSMVNVFSEPSMNEQINTYKLVSEQLSFAKNNSNESLYSHNLSSSKFENKRKIPTNFNVKNLDKLSQILKNTKDILTKENNHEF